MPRTKVNHKRQGKKNRCEYTEKLRDFDHLGKKVSFYFVTIKNADIKNIYSSG